MALQIRRGTNAERTALKFAQGELIYTTDTKRLYIGDGTDESGTSGGIDVSAGIEGIIEDTTPQLGGNLDLSGHSIIGSGNINIDGTITATGNINLGDASGDNINVAGSIGTSLIPISDSIVDIGSMSNRWNQGYFTGLTVGGQIDAVSFSGHLLAEDSTVVFDANTNTLRAESLSGTFTGDVVGNVTGDITGNAAGDHTGTFTGSISATGTFTGSISATGILDGDLNGSVFGDDSTLLVDGVNNTISGRVISGPIDRVERINTTISTEPGIEGDSSANFLRIYEDNNPSVVNISKYRGTIGSEDIVQAGDDIGLIRFVGYDGTGPYGCAAIIGSADPDGTVTNGAIPGKLRFQTYNNSGTPIDRAEFDYNGFFKTYSPHIGISTAPTGIPFYSLNHSNITSAGPRLLMRRARGTYDTPLTVADGDVLHRVTWGAHDGTSYLDTAFITGSVDGTVSTGVVPTKLEIKTTDSNGNVNTPLTVGTENEVSANQLSVTTSFKLPIYADSTARDTDITSPEAGMMVFLTGTSKAQVNTDGTIGGWVDLN